MKETKLFKGASLLLGLSLLGACAKTDEILPIQEQEQASETAKFYRAEAVWSPSSLRATLSSRGYASPKVSLSIAEFESYKQKAHFAFVGDKETLAGAVDQVLREEPSDLGSLKNNSLLIRQPLAEEGNTKLNLYCQVSDKLKAEKPAVCLALGGTLEGQLLHYTAEAGTSPNKLLKAVGSEEQELGRQIPLMTDFKAFDEVFAEDKPQAVGYNPRGSLISLAFLNQYDSPITITKLSFPRDNALFFEGSFDLSLAMDGSKPNLNSGEKAKFIGRNEEVEVDVQDTTLPVVLGDLKEAKLKSKLFHLWGFAHQGQQQFKMRIHFIKDGKAYRTKLFKLDAPEGGFGEGASYRLPILLNDEATSTKESGDEQPNVKFITPYNERPRNIHNYELKELKNTNRKYHYRIALPVSKAYYDKYFKSDEAVYAYWEKTVKYLNSLYNRDLGVYFTLVKDERLIARDEGVISAHMSSQSVLNTWGTLELNKMIGEEAYDVGVWLALVSTSLQGQARLGGVYLSGNKASAVVKNNNMAVIAHELGHMFGGKHTWQDTASSQRVEKGDGQSIMTHAGYSDFFSLVSVADIFDFLNFYPYATDPDRKNIVDPYSLSSVPGLPLSYYNIVYAEKVPTLAPEIDRAKLLSQYRVPVGTNFRIDIPVKHRLGNMFSAVNALKVRDAQFYTNKPTDKGCVEFQPVYSRAGGLDPLSELSHKAGKYPLMLGVSTFEANAAPQYDTEQIEIELVAAEPFVVTSGVVRPRDQAGRKLMLRWTADQAFFGKDSKVKISLSTNYGKSYDYVLEEETANDGACEVVLPYIQTEKIGGIYDEPVNACIIKVEEIGGIAYATTSYEPRTYGRFSGGFSIRKDDSDNYFFFVDYPKDILHLNSKSELPAPSSYTIRAEKRFSRSKIDVPLTYVEYPERRLADGRLYIVREWSAKYNSFKTYAFRQYIYIRD